MTPTGPGNDDGQGLQPLTVLKMAGERVLSATKHTPKQTAACNRRKWRRSRWNRTTFWVEERA